MATIRNLTPHAITLAPEGAERITIQPEAEPARVAASPGKLGAVPGLPVPVAAPTVYGQITGLPESADGVYYIVSALVGAGLRASGSTRTDVLCPGTGPGDGAIRNEAGHIIAVTRLVRP